MKIINLIKNNYTLISIIILGIFLRFWGIFYDLPLSSSVGDEIRLLSGSLKMLATKSFIPVSEHGIYFPLMYYVYLVGILIYVGGLFVFSDVNSLYELERLAMLNLGDWLIIGRIISLIFGVLSIYLIYLIALKIFKSRGVSLWSALLFCLSPFNVAISHFGKIWSPQVFFILLSFYLTLKYWQDTKDDRLFKPVLISSLLVLLSFSVNLIGMLSYGILIIIIWAYYCGFDFKKLLRFLFSKSSLLLHLILLAGLFLIFLISRDSFLTYGLGWQRLVVANSSDVVPWMAQIWDLSRLKRFGLALNILLQFETIVFLLLPISFYFLYKKQRDIFYLLASLFAMISLFVMPIILNSTRPRYLSILIPFMVIPVAYLLNLFFSQIGNKKKYLFIFLIAIIISPSLFIDIKYDYLLSVNSTKLDVYNWIEKNINPREKILVVGGYFLQDIIPDRQLSDYIKKYSADYYSSKLQYINDNNLDNDYGVYSSGFTCQWSKDINSGIDFDYIVLMDSIQQRAGILNPLYICDSMPMYYLGDAQVVFEQKTAPFYDYSIDTGIPIESYSPLWKIKKLGPQITIYKL